MQTRLMTNRRHGFFGLDERFDSHVWQRKASFFYFTTERQCSFAQALARGVFSNFVLIPYFLSLFFPSLLTITEYTPGCHANLFF